MEAQTPTQEQDQGLLSRWVQGDPSSRLRWVGLKKAQETVHQGEPVRRIEGRRACFHFVVLALNRLTTVLTVLYLHQTPLEGPTVLLVVHPLSQDLDRG